MRKGVNLFVLGYVVWAELVRLSLHEGWLSIHQSGTLYSETDGCDDLAVFGVDGLGRILFRACSKN